MRTCQCEFRLFVVIELLGASERADRVATFARAPVLTTIELSVVYIRVTSDTVRPSRLGERQCRETDRQQLE